MAYLWLVYQATYYEESAAEKYFALETCFCTGHNYSYYEDK